MIIWKMLEQFAAFFIWYFAAPQPTMRHSREIHSLTLRFNYAFLIRSSPAVSLPGNLPILIDALNSLGYRPKGPSRQLFLKIEIF